MPQTPPEFLQHLKRARRQLRTRWFVSGGLWAAAAALFVVALSLALQKQGWFDAHTRGLTTVAITLVAGLSTVLYTSRRIATPRLVLALDEKAELREKLLTWWELGSSSPSPGNAGHLEILKEQLEHETVLQQRLRVFSIQVSPAGSAALLLALAALGVAQLWDGPRTRAGLWQPPPIEEPVAQSSAETLFERDRLEDLREEVAATGNEEIAELYRQLHDALDTLELGESPAVVRARLSELEEQLRELSAANERDETIAALTRGASSLSDALTPLRQAIEDQDWSRAQQAIDETRARIGTAPEEHLPEARALRELAEAIDPRTEEAQRGLAELDETIEAARNVASGGEGEDPEGAPPQGSSAENASGSQGQQEELERRLEELRREANRGLSPEEQAQAELADELRDTAAGRQRPAGGAESGGAESGGAESGGAFSDLERASRDESAAESLRERAQSIERSAQRSGRGGNADARSEAMDDFLRRARGEAGESSSSSGRGGSQPAGRSGPTGAQQAQGASGGGGPETISRDSGEGQQQGSGGQGSGSSGAGRAGEGQGANGAGEGSGGDWRGAPGASSSEALARALEQEAIDSGEGLSRAETVEGAGEGGFARSEYRDVFIEYEEVADEVIDREEIPSGYRYYVERYFELITPRSER